MGEPTIPATGDHVLQWPAQSPDDYACVASATIADPLLGPLQHNGGFAPTMMPAADGPAVRAGVDCPATDERGHSRPAQCTLGAAQADGTGASFPSSALLDASASDER